MKFIYNIIILISVTFLKINDTSAQINNESHLNFTHFSNSSSNNIEDWKSHNRKTYYSHPEFGTLPENSPCYDCVEILEKRNTQERYFRDINDHTKIYYQKSYGILNDYIDGKWISVRNKLAKSVNGIYENRNSICKVQFDTKNQITSFIEQKQYIHFNNWYLLIEKEQKIIRKEKANWDNITIGEDGAYITNILDGIDAEMIVLRGSIKTNFIIKKTITAHLTI